MSSVPQTRNSLILRLRDPQNADAWREFVGIYEPVVYRLARRRGMQHADTLDLVQRVFLAVAKAVDRFEPDPERGRFRAWLGRIAHNEFCNQLAVSRRGAGSGDSAIHSLLESQSVSQDKEEFQVEYRRSVFQWAASRIETQVQPATWQAFYRTSVQLASVRHVAEELGLTIGAVYIARSRVMARLREEVKKYESQSASNSLGGSS